MVRHGTFAAISLFVSLYSLWYLATLNASFNRIVTLMQFLFSGSVDPTLLDTRVSYECDPVPKYVMSVLLEDQDALAYYSAAWSPDLFHQTLEASAEYVCLAFDTFYFARLQGLPLGMFYSLVPLSLGI